MEKESMVEKKTVKVKVNPRLDAAEYVASDGTRYGESATEISADEYKKLSGERINGFSPVVKEDS